MAATKTSIGMMEGAYFVGRQELLNWLNEFLGLNYTKVEQTANGAAVCQIFDALYPGSINMARVNFNARRDYEFLNNYKILQVAFTRLEIEKHIDVDRLMKAKYQDNLEFLQWIKCYFDRYYSGAPYDAAARRNKSGARPPTSAGGRPLASAPRTKAAPAAAQPPVRSQNRYRENAGVDAVGGARARARPAASADTVSRAEYEALQASAEELSLAVEELERERDFYFGKLRSIEIFCQTSDDASNSSALAEIAGMLYASDDEGIPGEENIPEGDAHALHA